MSTIHNPKNFRPEDYQIVDYLDNHPPEAIEFFLMGGGKGAAEAFKAAHAEWRANFHRYYGTHIPHHCDHCGHYIRYVTVCEHIPSGDMVAIGCDCTDNRLGLSVDQFRIKYLKDAAHRRQLYIQNVQQLTTMLERNPDFAAEWEWVRETQPDSSFLRDIAAKCHQYWGNLTERQISAFVCECVNHRRRERTKAAKQTATGPVPTGRVTIIGKIVSFKTQDNAFGIRECMLVELESGARVYGTQPRAFYGCERGDMVTFAAKVEASRDNPSFGFYSRPTKTRVLSA